jgi:hypothetical protein
MKDFEVLQIKPKESHDFILHRHYARRLPPISYAYGLFQSKKIVGICTFGMPASPSLCKGIMGEENKHLVLVLNRLFVDSNQKNVTSWFVSRCLKLLPKPKCIVSYADTAMGHVGKIYQACNFMFTGTTKPRTDMASLPGKHSRHNLGDITKRQHRSAKHRYVYFVGDKRERKYMAEHMKYPILPYPQGVPKRYDASYDSILSYPQFV